MRLPCPRAMGDFAKQVASGGAAGMASTLLCHPLDTIRTRLQTAEIRGLKYAGAVDCAVKTASREGVRAFYKGLLSPLLAQCVYKAVIFTVYGTTLQSIAAPPQGAREGGTPPLAVVMAAGAVAGGVNSLVVTPVELVRNNLMVQRGFASSNVSPVQLVAETVRASGVLGLWRGVGATMLRDSVGVAVWFGAFQVGMRHVNPAIGLEGIPGLLGAGMLGGAGFWLAAFPLDTIKSIVQVQDRSRPARTAIGVASDLWVKRNLAKLYRGLGVALVRGIPGAAVTFAVQRRVHEALQAATRGG